MASSMKRGRSRSDDPPPSPATSKRIKPSPTILNVAVEHIQWTGGSQQRVTWSSTGDVPNISAQLCQGGSLNERGFFIKSLCRSAANTGSTAVTVPLGLTPGPYQLRIESTSDRNDVYSATSVEIDMGAVPPVITSVEIDATQWTGGSLQQIRWSSQGEIPGVSARLYFEGVFVKHLCRGVANTGSTTVTVPVGLTPGAYELRVASHALTDLMFVPHAQMRDLYGTASVEIDTGAVPPGITNVGVEDRHWTGGSTQRITWSSQGDIPGVSARLYQLGGIRERFVKTLFRSVPNTGSTTVTIPLGLTPGSYQLRVASIASTELLFMHDERMNDCYGATVVEIDAGSVAPAISNVSIKQHLVASTAVPCHASSQQQLMWSSEGDVPSVRAELYRGGRYVKMLFDSAVNTGSAAVTIPVGLTPGLYQVRVESKVNIDAFALSKPFTIDDEHRERCVRYALLLLALPPQQRLPYAIVRKIAVVAATD